MDAIWYVMHAGKITGPFTAAEVKEGIRQGQIEPTDDLGTGNGEWQNARLWDELSTLPAPCLPGPENQPAFSEDAVKYPAPPPLPASTTSNSQNNTPTGCWERIITFIGIGLTLAFFKQQFDAKQQNKFSKKPNSISRPLSR